MNKNVENKIYKFLDYYYGDDDLTYIIDISHNIHRYFPIANSLTLIRVILTWSYSRKKYVRGSKNYRVWITM